MAPVIQELHSVDGIDCKVCITGQHRELVDQTLNLFGIESDYDLEIEGDGRNRQPYFNCMSSFTKVTVTDICTLHEQETEVPNNYRSTNK